MLFLGVPSCHLLNLLGHFKGPQCGYMPDSGGKFFSLFVKGLPFPSPRGSVINRGSADFKQMFLSWRSIIIDFTQLFRDMG